MACPLRNIVGVAGLPVLGAYACVDGAPYACVPVESGAACVCRERRRVCV